jgi:hypothetical protein
MYVTSRTPRVSTDRAKDADMVGHATPSRPSGSPRLTKPTYASR